MRVTLFIYNLRNTKGHGFFAMVLVKAYWSGSDRSSSADLQSCPARV